MEMKVIEIPARVPSMAALGVYFRIVGPMKAPIRMITPIVNAQASPASHASTGSLVLSRVGSMTTNTTRNMCGTLGP